MTPRVPRWATLAVLALSACTSTVVQCGACPGSYLDPNGLIRPGDAVASVRVCLDDRCATQTYPAADRQFGQYAAVTGTYPPHPKRIDRLQVTTLDATDAVIRTVVARSLDLPAVKTHDGPCACSGFVFRYDAAAHRFTVTTQ